MFKAVIIATLTFLSTSIVSFLGADALCLWPAACAYTLARCAYPLPGCAYVLILKSICILHFTIINFQSPFLEGQACPATAGSPTSADAQFALPLNTHTTLTRIPTIHKQYPQSVGVQASACFLPGNTCTHKIEN